MNTLRSRLHKGSSAGEIQNLPLKFSFSPRENLSKSSVLFDGVLKSLYEYLHRQGANLSKRHSFGKRFSRAFCRVNSFFFLQYIAVTCQYDIHKKRRRPRRLPQTPATVTKTTMTMTMTMPRSWRRSTCHACAMCCSLSSMRTPSPILCCWTWKLRVLRTLRLCQDFKYNNKEECIITLGPLDFGTRRSHPRRGLPTPLALLARRTTGSDDDINSNQHNAENDSMAVDNDHVTLHTTMSAKSVLQNQRAPRVAALRALPGRDGILH